MSKGYSLRLLEANKEADQKKLGVRLGRLCIQHDVPVQVVANNLKVSRTTIYNWFVGSAEPHTDSRPMVESYIASLS